MSVDFRDWSVKLQEQCVDNICDIFNKYKIPYMRDKINRPRQQITLLPFAGHTDALLAIYATQSIEIERLRNELYRLRGMTKNEWQETEDLLHSK